MEVEQPLVERGLKNPNFSKELEPSQRISKKVEEVVDGFSWFLSIEGDPENVPDNLYLSSCFSNGIEFFGSSTCELVISNGEEVRIPVRSNIPMARDALVLKEGRKLLSYSVFVSFFPILDSELIKLN